MSVKTIEFVKNRLYLAACDSYPRDTKDTVYLFIDDVLVYAAFNMDFGPLSLGAIARFAAYVREALDSNSKRIILYSSTDSRYRANAACLVCAYLILYQSWPPHLAILPITQAEPQFMPFRDAGYAIADFELTIQDVVYGLWVAKEAKILDVLKFNLGEYEVFERPENGDLTYIANDFVAFASPVQPAGQRLEPTFEKVLNEFVKNGVKLVVRCNQPLYDKREFEKRGIQHVDLIYEDGSCPGMAYVQAFIGAAQETIRNGGKVAVHCRAGLGRTGCLIGAYLLYAHRFSARDAIGYMRVLRPGMVVGAQQHWLYLHQHEFKEWKHTMAPGPPDASMAGLRPLVPLAKALEAPAEPHTPQRGILVNSENVLPRPTPGQPRKSPQRVCASTEEVVVPRRASRYKTNVDGSAQEPLTLAKNRRVATEHAGAYRNLPRSLRVTSVPSPRHRSRASSANDLVVVPGPCPMGVSKDA